MNLPLPVARCCSCLLLVVSGAVFTPPLRGAESFLPIAAQPGPAINYADLAFYPERWKERQLSTQLYPWTGRSLVFLTTHTNLDASIMSRFLARLDEGWQLYQHLTGRSPERFKQLEEKPVIAALPDAELSCGYGCGYIGATGIEVGGFYDHDYPLVKDHPQAFAHYYFYEMGRNFYTFGDRHSLFITGYAVFMRYVCMDVLGCEDLDRPTRATIEAAETLYAKSDLDFLRGFTSIAGLDEKAPRLRQADGSPLHPSDQPVLYASAMMKLRRDYGGEAWVKRFFAHLAQCPEISPDSTETARRQCLSWLVAASCAARRDLSGLFVDRWRMPLDPARRAQLSQIDWQAADLDAAVVLRQLETGLEAAQLRCEYLENPLAIHTQAPRLSWVLRARGGQPLSRGQKQSAYRVLAASSADRLARDEGDLWDSGQVPSDQSIQVPYAGVPLASHQQVFWKVRVWDQQDRPTAWSAPASWTMGLLADPDDWQASWLTAPTHETLRLQGSQWIWFPEGQPHLAAPVGSRFFQRTLDLPADVGLLQATALVSADNQFTLFVNGQPAGEGDGWQAARRVDLTQHLRAGPNVIAIAVRNTANAPNPAGLIAKIVVRLSQGANLMLTTDQTWQTTQTEPPGWPGAQTDQAGWTNAMALGPLGMQPWGSITSETLGPLPLFRREFHLDHPPRRALIHLCGLGQYELRLNGRKIGDHEMDPGWTDYRDRCLYVSYDLTPHLRPGANTLGVLLGNGMYHVAGGRYVKFTGSFGPPQFLAHLRLEFPDGSVQTIPSDASWKTAPGPITFSCIYGGEDYDARREQEGWDSPGFDDATWSAAQAAPGPGGKLRPQTAPPSKAQRTYATRRISEPEPGIFVYDLGQNFSGWPCIQVRGPAGATLKLVPGELLDANGLVSQRHSGSPVSFSYTLKGQGSETWRPRFTYYGFRYVQVEGATPASMNPESREPVLLKLEGQFIHSSARVAGQFTCSNPLINRIHDLIDRAIESNLQSVLTDCPHREKLGWLEVSHLLGQAIMFNYDVPTLYRKICDDMSESQLENGLVPDIAPEYTVFSGGFRDSPEWGSASVINPWLLYQHYGDARVLADHYQVMQRYAAYLGRQAHNHVVSHGLGDWYDIGPRPPGESQLTSRGVTATAVYYQDLRILEQTARLLGKTDDATRYEALAAEVGVAFNRQFYQSDLKQYDRGSQTAQAMPLVLGLVPPKDRPAVQRHLVENVRHNQNRVTAGDVGFVYLVRALQHGGHGAVLFDMVTQTNGPGYAEQLRQGATSLTEAWDANPNSSHNHCMLGHAEEWFYTGLAGIRPDPRGPGFKQFIIQPDVVGDLTWVRAHYDSMHGRIHSAWERKDGTLSLHVIVPPNTTATVHIPTSDPAAVTESGHPLTQAPGLRVLRLNDASVTIEASSGQYRFESLW